MHHCYCRGSFDSVLGCLTRCGIPLTAAQWDLLQEEDGHKAEAHQDRAEHIHIVDPACQADSHRFHQLRVDSFALCAHVCELREHPLLDIGREQNVWIVKDTDGLCG